MKHLDKISGISSLEELETIKIELFGKGGYFTSLVQNLKNLDGKQRSEEGKRINEIKKEALALWEEKKAALDQAALDLKLQQEAVDLTIPGRKRELGRLHPIEQIMVEAKSFFANMGFQAVEGPEIETVFRNFDALNVPDSHPSRHSSDTFYIKEKVLRTHTTTVQIRCLESMPLPIFAISTGKVYRPDYDASHTPMFHQLDGIFLTDDGSFANLKYVLGSFIKALFPNVNTRFRPHYFPFTEPSAELDMSCSCKKGCGMCKGTGWIEILGCGMISPEVLKHFNLKGSGFAFGMGLERLLAIRYGLKDIRMLYDNDLRLLKQL